MDDPHPSSDGLLATEKVQRLDGGGFLYNRELEIKSVLPARAECVVTEPFYTRKINGSLRLNLTQHGETHQVQTQ